MQEGRGQEGGLGKKADRAEIQVKNHQLFSICKMRFCFLLQDHKKEICHSLKQLSPDVPLTMLLKQTVLRRSMRLRLVSIRSDPLPSSSSSWKGARPEGGIGPRIYLSVASFFAPSDQHIGSGCESCYPELAPAAVGGQRGDCAPSFAPVPLPIWHSEHYKGTLCRRDCVVLFGWGGDGVIIFIQWELAIWNKPL